MTDSIHNFIQLNYEVLNWMKWQKDKLHVLISDQKLDCHKQIDNGVQ